ncbi:prephenate dehydratase [Synechococcus sp. PCC 7502]|uniref:prephenate dehydratase n=1 Tax=Synechococcus sp. PCC 7502 TaxID=1173263 RepID=UPI00029FB021|nr:prephenate dehydratase [Synechococcus sp. PCC 7502]AFY73917.1 prephenate dehydratase [Synechococcus sp. PCC 7502]
MTSIAYLGPTGTYAELAALSYCQLHHLPDSQLCSYPTIPQALKAVATGEIDRAIVPVENSTQGSVTMTLDSIWLWDQLQIQEALVLPVQHALITHAQSLEQIQAVHSHPQSLAQCQNWLEQFLPQAQLIPGNSNTEKMEDVSQDLHLAAIASPSAAKLYNLPILRFPTNDFSDNCTRFWVLGLVPTDQGKHTSLAFTTKSNEPGSLFNPLAVFAKRHINLTRIESRPSKRSHNPYIFFIDIEASIPEITEAIAELKEFTETLKIFGSYDIHIQPNIQPS